MIFIFSIFLCFLFSILIFNIHFDTRITCHKFFGFHLMFGFGHLVFIPAQLLESCLAIYCCTLTYDFAIPCLFNFTLCPSEFIFQFSYFALFGNQTVACPGDDSYENDGNKYDNIELNLSIGQILAVWSAISRPLFALFDGKALIIIYSMTIFIKLRQTTLWLALIMLMTLGIIRQKFPTIHLKQILYHIF